MTGSELSSRVRARQEVVLRESNLVFLARSLGPALMVVIGAGVAALMGTEWLWVVAGLGAVASVGILLWTPFRKVPQVSVSPQGITFEGELFEWTAIETFCSGSLEYTLDWISLTTSDGELKDLESTFGWKKNVLRDALNNLLTEYNQDSTRAQFAERQETTQSP